MSSGLFHNVLVASDNSACKLNYGIIPARLRAVSFVALLCRGSVFMSSSLFFVRIFQNGKRKQKQTNMDYDFVFRISAFVAHRLCYLPIFFPFVLFIVSLFSFLACSRNNTHTQ